MLSYGDSIFLFVQYYIYSQQLFDLAAIEGLLNFFIIRFFYKFTFWPTNSIKIVLKDEHLNCDGKMKKCGCILLNTYYNNYYMVKVCFPPINSYNIVVVNKLTVYDFRQNVGKSPRWVKTAWKYHLVRYNIQNHG